MPYSESDDPAAVRAAYERAAGPGPTVRPSARLNFEQWLHKTFPDKLDLSPETVHSFRALIARQAFMLKVGPAALDVDVVRYQPDGLTRVATAVLALATANLFSQDEARRLYAILEESVFRSDRPVHARPGPTMVDRLIEELERLEKEAGHGGPRDAAQDAGGDGEGA